MRIKPLVAMTAAVLVLTVAGCSNANEKPADPYAAEYERARAKAWHPEIRKALEDGKITDEEVARAKQIALECLSENGHPGKYVEDDGLMLPMSDDFGQAEADALLAKCSGATFDLLKPLKEKMEYNPQNIPVAQQLVDCYKRMNLVPQSMTADEFVQIDLNNPPWDKLSGDADGCMTDPLNYKGGQPDLTEEEAASSTFVPVAPPVDNGE